MSALRKLPDGRILELVPMLFTVRLTVSLPELYGVCYEDGWCFTDPAAAVLAFETWDGEGDGPPGWNKHPFTGRWRKDGTPASEINQWQDPKAEGAT